MIPIKRHFSLLLRVGSKVQQLCTTKPCNRPSAEARIASTRSRARQDHAFMDVTVFDEHGHIFWAVSLPQRKGNTQWKLSCGEPTVRHHFIVMMDSPWGLQYARQVELGPQKESTQMLNWFNGPTMSYLAVWVTLLSFEVCPHESSIMRERHVQAWE